jgi:low temperature requirement protein LtrA
MKSAPLRLASLEDIGGDEQEVTSLELFFDFAFVFAMT